MALGVTSTETWEQADAQLGPGDVLVLYSDGVTDAENTEGEPFGHERLKASVTANPECSALELQDAVLTGVREFARGTVQFDDVTLMIVTRDL